MSNTYGKDSQQYQQGAYAALANELSVRAIAATLVKYIDIYNQKFTILAYNYINLVKKFATEIANTKSIINNITYWQEIYIDPFRYDLKIAYDFGNQTTDNKNNAELEIINKLQLLLMQLSFFLKIEKNKNAGIFSSLWLNLKAIPSTISLIDRTIEILKIRANAFHIFNNCTNISLENVEQKSKSIKTLREEINSLVKNKVITTSSKYFEDVFIKIKQTETILSPYLQELKKPLMLDLSSLSSFNISQSSSIAVTDPLDSFRSNSLISVNSLLDSPSSLDDEKDTSLIDDFKTPLQTKVLPSNKQATNSQNDFATPFQLYFENNATNIIDVKDDFGTIRHDRSYSLDCELNLSTIKPDPSLYTNISVSPNHDRSMSITTSDTNTPINITQKPKIGRSATIDYSNSNIYAAIHQTTNPLPLYKRSSLPTQVVNNYFDDHSNVDKLPQSPLASDMTLLPSSPQVDEDSNEQILSYADPNQDSLPELITPKINIFKPKSLDEYRKESINKTALQTLNDYFFKFLKDNQLLSANYDNATISMFLKVTAFVKGLNKWSGKNRYGNGRRASITSNLQDRLNDILCTIPSFNINSIDTLKLAHAYHAYFIHLLKQKLILPQQNLTAIVDIAEQLHNKINLYIVNQNIIVKHHINKIKKLLPSFPKLDGNKFIPEKDIAKTIAKISNVLTIIQSFTETLYQYKDILFNEGDLNEENLHQFKNFFACDGINSICCKAQIDQFVVTAQTFTKMLQTFPTLNDAFSKIQSIIETIFQYQNNILDKHYLTQEKIDVLNSFLDCNSLIYTCNSKQIAQLAETVRTFEIARSRILNLYNINFNYFQQIDNNKKSPINKFITDCCYCINKLFTNVLIKDYLDDAYNSLALPLDKNLISEVEIDKNENKELGTCINQKEPNKELSLTNAPNTPINMDKNSPQNSEQLISTLSLISEPIDLQEQCIKMESAINAVSPRNNDETTQKINESETECSLADNTYWKVGIAVAMTAVCVLAIPITFGLSMLAAFAFDCLIITEMGEKALDEKLKSTQEKASLPNSMIKPEDNNTINSKIKTTATNNYLEKPIPSTEITSCIAAKNIKPWHWSDGGARDMPFFSLPSDAAKDDYNPPPQQRLAINK